LSLPAPMCTMSVRIISFPFLPFCCGVSSTLRPKKEKGCESFAALQIKKRLRPPARSPEFFTFGELNHSFSHQNHGPHGCQCRCGAASVTSVAGSVAGRNHIIPSSIRSFYPNIAQIHGIDASTSGPRCHAKSRNQKSAINNSNELQLACTRCMNGV